MEFRVLGPVEVRNGDARVALGGPRRRALLAVLLLNANRVVPVDRLIGAVWGEAPPATATAQVQAAVSALRRALRNDASGNEGLDGERIITQAPGYLVRLSPGELDLELFERDADVARRALAEGDVEQAAAGLRAALDWWRGAALSDLADSSMRALAVGLEERRTAALEERIEADLALGRHGVLVPELTALVAENPLRERLRGQLMLALYRSGRQADALAGYRNTRDVLVDELGLEPGPELQRLEQQILGADPALDVAPAVRSAPRAESGALVRPPCPYRGLTAFGVTDHHVFFGRRAEIAELVARLQAPGPVTVVGPSGCGKSSLIFAGVLPVLGAEVVTFRPSDARSVYTGLAAALIPALEPDLSPPDQLGLVSGLAQQLEGDGLGEAVSRALSRTGGEELVLVIDQVEELLAQHPQQVDRFAEQVFGTDAPPELKVVATMRADFLDAALSRPALSAPLRQSIYTLGAMTAEQLREVVTEPVAGTGVEFQDGLIERVLSDVGTDPGSLPLLGLTLTLLWERQSDAVLTHQAYDDLGRVTGSLARYAEEVWRRSNLADEQDDARQLFTQLICVGAGGEVTRRVASRDDLGERRWGLARRLATSRLLVAGQDAEGRETVELAHEALVRGWSRLAGWIDEDREFRQWQEGLRADLARWERGGRDPNLLSRGAALSDAQRWSDERAGDLSPSEIDFIGRAGSHQRAGSRRRTLVRSGLALGVVLTLVLGSLFVYQRGVAERRSADAASRALAAASGEWADRDPVYSALLALAAYRAQPTDEATSALFRPYLESQGATSVFSSPQAGLSDVQVSRDGRVVAGATTGQTITVWTRTPGQETRRISMPILQDRGAVLGLAPDGAAVWLVDDGWLSRFDVSSGELRRVVEVGRAGGKHLAVSADGATVVVVISGDAARTAVVWDALAGRRGPDRALPAGESLMKVSAGPDGSLVAQLRDDGAGQVERVEVWGPGASRVLAQGMSRIVVTPGGDVAVTCVATGQLSGRMAAIRIADGVELGRADLDGPCLEFAVDPSGLTVVNEEGLSSASVLDLRTGETVSRVRAPLLDDVVRARPLPALVGSGDDLQLALWNESRVALLEVPAPGAALPEMAYSFVSSDGGSIGGVLGNGLELRIYPVDGPEPRATAARPAPYWRSGPASLAVDADDGLIADRVAADRVAVRRLPSLDLVREITTPPVPPADLEGDGAPQTYSMFFDRSGRLITVVGPQVDVWDVQSGARRAHLDLVALGHATPEEIVQLGAGHDPDRLGLVVEGRPDVRFLDVVSGRQVATVPVGDDVDAALFHGSSSQLLIVRSGGAVEMWDTEERRRVLGPLVADADFGRQVGMLDGPGRFVVSDYGQYRIWKVGAPDPELAVRLGESHRVSAASGGDGRTVLYRGVGNDYVGVLQLEPAAWRDPICSVIGRRAFSDDERAGLPPSTSDEPLCP